jgi:hypothetical protein
VHRYRFALASVTDSSAPAQTQLLGQLQSGQRSSHWTVPISVQAYVYVHPLEMQAHCTVLRAHLCQQANTIRTTTVWTNSRETVVIHAMHSILFEVLVVNFTVRIVDSAAWLHVKQRAVCDEGTHPVLCPPEHGTRISTSMHTRSPSMQ